MVVDQFLTDTARMAHYVLPAKTLFEEEDLVTAYWHPYLQLRQKVLDPPPGVRTETEIWRELCRSVRFPHRSLHRDPEERLRGDAARGAGRRAGGAAGIALWTSPGRGDVVWRTVGSRPRRERWSSPPGRRRGSGAWIRCRTTMLLPEGPPPGSALALPPSAPHVQDPGADPLPVREPLLDSGGGPPAGCWTSTPRMRRSGPRGGGPGPDLERTGVRGGARYG